MNLSYKEYIHKDLDPQSRVWVYQASRLLTMSEALEAEEMVNHFIANWLSHGDAVKAQGLIIFGRFVVLMADERSGAGVSGCSTDSSVRFIKMLGEKFGIDFFNRQSLAFVVKDTIEILPLPQLQYALDNGFITADTIYFNNLVATKKELEEHWMIAVKDSWLGKRLKVAT